MNINKLWEIVKIVSQRISMKENARNYSIKKIRQSSKNLKHKYNDLKVSDNKMTYEAMIREATQNDLLDILNIYNQGIEDRIATLDDTPKSYEEIKQWYQQHSNRYAVLVLTVEGRIRGWASLNPYSHRRAYAGVAELSIYIDRAWRGKGLGTMLIKALEEKAKANGFYKMVLFTFPFNQLGQNLYRKCGFREVGVFKNQGRLDGKWVDVMAMEKLLCEE